MNHEEKSSEPPPVQVQAVKQTPDQKPAGDVQGQTAKMITQRLISPQVPLDPEQRPSQWPVIGCGGRQPYVPKTLEAAKVGIIRDQQIIIPDPARVKRRPINPQTCRHDYQRLEHRLRMERRRFGCNSLN